MVQQGTAREGKQPLKREEIDKIAEKVYALWKRDLQILRERRRTHGRSFPKR